MTIQIVMYAGLLLTNDLEAGTLRANCPSVEQVQRAIAAVDPGSSKTLYRISRSDDNRHHFIEVLAPNGDVIARRKVELPYDCEERARYAALVMASWKTALYAEADGSELTLSPHIEARPTQPIPDRGQTAHQKLWEIGFGVAVANSPSWSPAIAINATRLLPHQDSMRGGVFLSQTMPTSRELGGGIAKAVSTTIMGQLSYRQDVSQGAAVEVLAGFGLASTTGWGQDYASNLRDVGWDTGIVGGLRYLFQKLNDAGLTLDARCLWKTNPTTLHVNNSDGKTAEASLPNFVLTTSLIYDFNL